MAPNAAAHAAVIDHRGKNVEFEFMGPSLRFVPAHLLVQRIEKLLPRRCSAKAVRWYSVPPIADNRADPREFG